MDLFSCLSDIFKTSETNTLYKIINEKLLDSSNIENDYNEIKLSGFNVGRLIDIFCIVGTIGMRMHNNEKRIKNVNRLFELLKNDGFIVNKTNVISCIITLNSNVFTSISKIYPELFDYEILCTCVEVNSSIMLFKVLNAKKFDTEELDKLITFSYKINNERLKDIIIKFRDGEYPNSITNIESFETKLITEDSAKFLQDGIKSFFKFDLSAYTNMPFI